MRDLHHLDFVELMLANQASHVLAIGPGLAAEAGRVRGVFERQLRRRRGSRCDGDSSAALRPSESRNRSQSPAILNRSASNFGSCPVAFERRAIHQEGRRHLDDTRARACAGRA